MKPLGVALLLLSFGAVPVFAQSSTAPGCGASGTLPKIWEGQAYAASGDTLSGVGLKMPIKLWGVRAPEMTTTSVAAMRSRAALEDMLVSGEHKVSCKIVGWDRACNATAQCTVTAAWPTGSAPQPHDLALRLAEDGFAYGADLGTPPEWDKDASEKVAHFEAIARQARKGLWPSWLGEETKPQ